MASRAERALMPEFAVMQLTLWPQALLPVANGPFMAVKKSEYMALGGHRTIGGSDREDVDLARVFAAARRSVRMLYGTDLAETRHTRRRGRCSRRGRRPVWRGRDKGCGRHAGWALVGGLVGWLRWAGLGNGRPRLASLVAVPRWTVVACLIGGGFVLAPLPALTGGPLFAILAPLGLWRAATIAILAYRRCSPRSLPTAGA